MTRVRKNLPPLTLRLSGAFVKVKTPVSTGILRFSLVFLWKTADFGVFQGWSGRKAAWKAGLERFVTGDSGSCFWPEV